MADNETTGTTDQDGGDAAATQTAGTPDAAGRNAAGSGINPEEALVWKSKAEKYNELEKRLAELEAERDTPAPETDTSSEDADFEQWVQKNDPVAKRVKMLEHAVLLREQLRDIPDKDEREEVRKHFLANRHRFGDIEVAHADIRARKYEAENRRLQEELKRREANKPDPNVARTAEREVTASQNQARKMSYAQFDSQVAALESAGKDKEARALRNELRYGRLELTP